MYQIQFDQWLVLVISLVTTVAWLGSIYYASSKSAKAK